jgi:hypothetical protein
MVESGLKTYEIGVNCFFQFYMENRMLLLTSYKIDTSNPSKGLIIKVPLSRLEDSDSHFLFSKIGKESMEVVATIQDEQNQYVVQKFQMRCKVESFEVGTSFDDGNPAIVTFYCQLLECKY